MTALTDSQPEGYSGFCAKSGTSILCDPVRTMGLVVVVCVASVALSDVVADVWVPSVSLFVVVLVVVVLDGMIREGDCPVQNRSRRTRRRAAIQPHI